MLNIFVTKLNRRNHYHNTKNSLYFVISIP